MKHYITALALSLSSTLCVAQTSSPSTTPAPAETAVATPAPVAAAPATTSAVVTALYTGKPRVLITGHDAYTEAVQANGSGVAVGRAVLGSASGTKTFSQHSEVWEVTRHFMDECKGVSVVTDPAAAHDYTVLIDTQTFSSVLLGTNTLYQLVALGSDGNPVFVTKKEFLKREIKPTCKAILERGAANTNAKGK